MNKDIKSQLDRTKELQGELEESCNKDLASHEVSSRTKNLTQEVVLKLRHVLDQAFFSFYEKNYLPNLTAEEKKAVRVYFPIVKKKEDLDSVLGRAKMKSLKKDFPDVYSFIDSVQPYNSDYSWLEQFKEVANEKHIRLTPQIKRETKRVTVSNHGGSVSWGPGVTFGKGVSVQGVPIDPQTQLPVPNKTVKTEITKWVSFLFEGTDINVLSFNKKAVEKIEKIVTKISSY